MTLAETLLRLWGSLGMFVNFVCVVGIIIIWAVYFYMRWRRIKKEREDDPFMSRRLKRK